MRLKEFRLKANLSQDQLANLSGVLQSYISGLENGTTGSRVPAETLKRLASVLGCTIDDLLADAPAGDPSNDVIE